MIKPSKESIRTLRRNHAIVKIAFGIIKNNIGIRKQQCLILALIVQAKSHILDDIDAGAVVVPAAIKEHQLLCSRKVSRITLKIPATIVPIGRLA